MSVAGDQARVTVMVRVPVAEAFRVFTEEIDQWWRRGLKYRVAGKRDGTIALEPGVGGRLFESYVTGKGERTIQTGEVTVWEPPRRLVFTWRAVNFKADDPSTEVEVAMRPFPDGAAEDTALTEVTVTHRGWAAVRPDHPARHGHEVAAFLRMMGMWWGDLMSSLRVHTMPDDE